LWLGNPGDVKPVGDGILELRIDHGPGYRVYYVQKAKEFVVLRAGGDKASQVRDIQQAKASASNLQEQVMAKTVTTPWDPADHLDTKEDMAAYLEAALEEGDPALVAAALGDIARAKGMTQIAREAGLGRESSYKALSPGGNPEFATIMRVVVAVGLKLHAVPAGAKNTV
jgi:probable addiction module antidote protein